MSNKLMKLSALTTVSAMVLAGCTAPSETILDQSNITSSTPNTENEHLDIETVPDTMTEEEYADMKLEEELANVEDSEFFNTCDKWEEDDDGSVECLDENSEYYAQHFFNGLMFATVGAMVGNSMYKSMNKRDGELRQSIINNAVVSPNNKSSKSNANSSKTTNSSGNVKSSSNNNSSNNSSTNNSYSNSNTNSYSNSSNSYSSGKSGFSSGGASRGGSASS
ncbi:hypothetical protein [Solibacillus sp. NPDC093137]|uniref:hypothetical protein n=1 Tax=Solibacillus sp. NPDC093137 TaxID=3390678 RepID=UPI003D0007FC